MLQAWITSPHGSLYFAAPATAYNLETLRSHVRALRDEEAHRTCLSLNLGDTEDGAIVTRVSALVTALTLEGIDVRVTEAAATSRPSRAAGRRQGRRRGTGAPPTAMSGSRG